MRAKLSPLHPEQVQAEVAVKRLEQQVGAALRNYGLELRSDAKGDYSVGFTGERTIRAHPDNGTDGFLDKVWENLVGLCSKKSERWKHIDALVMSRDDLKQALHVAAQKMLERQ